METVCSFEKKSTFPFNIPTGLWLHINVNGDVYSLLTVIIIFSCVVLVVTTVLQKKQACGEDILTVKPYLDTVLKNDQNFEVSAFLPFL